MIPAFTVSPHVAARLQDEIAAHMLAATPRHMRPIITRFALPAGMTSAQIATLASSGMFAAEREAMTPRVLEMRSEGMVQREIASQLGMSRYRVARIISEAGA